jgi:hypothetical protein
MVMQTTSKTVKLVVNLLNCTGQFSGQIPDNVRLYSTVEGQKRLDML